MLKNLLYFIIFIIFYYIITFTISFTSISNAVSNNNYNQLKNYINTKDLKKNIYNDFLNFSLSKVDLIDNKIEINDDSVQFTGKLTSIFFKKIFLKISNNISQDFSDAKIMLYFYFNSNEISKYINYYIKNFGEYNFEKYLIDNLENNIDNTKQQIRKETQKNSDLLKNINNDKNQESFYIYIQKRFQSIEYFFLINPINFKIKVEHQNITFEVILNFNGFKWKISRIIIPYENLVNLN